MSDLIGAPTSFDESFLLAEALEHALGNSDTPTSLHGPALTELSSLVILVRRLEGSTDTVGPSETFRTAARLRLLDSMRETAALPAPPVRQRQSWRFRAAVPGWFARVAAGLSAVAFAGAATAGASASALPGDPLYGIKQATEQVALVSAADDTARQQVLLRQADRRLDETCRLLEQGRDVEAGQNALRYSEVLEVTTGTVGAAEPVATTLQADRARLASLLAAAPPPARPGLQHALDTAERGLARAQHAAPPEVRVAPKSAEARGADDQRPEPAEARGADDRRPDPAEARGTDDRRPDPAEARGADDRRLEPAEARAEQSPDDGLPQTVAGGQAAAGPTRPVGPPQRSATSDPPQRSATSGPPQQPTQSVPAVDKHRGAPPSEVQPARHGHP